MHNVVDQNQKKTEHTDDVKLHITDCTLNSDTIVQMIALTLSSHAYVLTHDFRIQVLCRSHEGLTLAIPPFVVLSKIYQRGTVSNRQR